MNLPPLTCKFFTHFCTRLTFVSTDKLGKAFKKRKQAVLIINYIHASFTRNFNYCFHFFFHFFFKLFDVLFSGQ